MIAGLGFNGIPIMGNLNFAGGAAVVASLAATAAAASAAEAAASAGAATPVLISASTTISAPGYYVIGAAGVTLTIALGSTWATLGPVIIKDMSGANNPAIVLAATIDGSSAGLTLANPGQAVRLDWSPAFDSWLQS